jgi:hypothetical protein
VKKHTVSDDAASIAIAATTLREEYIHDEGIERVARKRRYILNFVAEVAPMRKRKIAVLSEVVFKANEILVITPEGFTVDEVLGDDRALMPGLPLPAVSFSAEAAIELRSIDAHAVDAQKEFALVVTNHTDAALTFRGHLMGFGATLHPSVLLGR